MATNLLNFLSLTSVSQAKAFLDNRVDDGQFPNGESAEEITVREGDLDGWIFEFSSWLEQNADEIATEFVAHPESEPMQINDFIQQVENLPALQIKRALISYFGESVHNGWDGWNKVHADGLQLFMKDFLLGLEAEGDQYKQPISIWGVDVKSEL